MKSIISIFGEAEKGVYNRFTPIQTLPQLVDTLGNPTESGIGIHLAVQTLMYDHAILFYRITSEGFSPEEYLLGFKTLLKLSIQPAIAAIALPGVGNSKIIDGALEVCNEHKSFIIVTEQDLYDFMTQR